MRIGFSGHRNRIAVIPDWIYEQCPDSTWVHGGAEGFDAQVDAYAKERGIPVEVIRPDYKSYPPKLAPLKRNEIIVDTTDMLVVCFDGRKTGGTRYTLSYAQSRDKMIVYLEYQE